MINSGETYLTEPFLEPPKFFLLFFLPLLFCFPNSYGGEKAIDNKYLGDVLVELTDEFGYDLILDCKHCKDFSLLTIEKPVTFDKGLKRILGEMNYVLEHKDNKRIVVHLLSDTVLEGGIGTGEGDQLMDDSVIHHDGKDFKISTTLDDIEEIVSIPQPIEDNELGGGHWVAIEGPDELDEMIWVSDKHSAFAQIHDLSDAVSVKLSKIEDNDLLVNDVLETSIFHHDDEALHISNTSDGLQEIVKIQRSDEDGKQRKGNWISMEEVDGLDEKIWVSD